MVSYFASEQERLRAYRKDRRLKEELEEDQQERLDELLDKQNGLDDNDTVWKTAMPNAIRKLGKQAKQAKQDGGSILLNAINSGKLDELIKMVRSVDETDFKNAGVEGGFNRNMKSMINRLKDEQERMVLNMLIGEQVNNGPEAIKEAIVNYITDGKPELRNNFYKMLNMVSSNFNVEDFDTVADISKRKIKGMEEMETSLMEEEDKRSRQIQMDRKILDRIQSRRENTGDKIAREKMLADLDLLALFQQDVKEGNVRKAKMEAMEKLRNLTAEEDLKIRQNFFNVLQELKKNKALNESKKDFEEKKKMIDKMMELIEKQRMEDSFQEFSKLAAKNEFASKLQRNMKALMENKKIRQQAKERSGMKMEDVDINPLKKGRSKIPVPDDVKKYKELLKKLEMDVGGRERQKVRDDMSNIERRLKRSNNFDAIQEMFDKKQLKMNK
jgi:hypothetical protein